VCANGREGPWSRENKEGRRELSSPKHQRPKFREEMGRCRPAETYTACPAVRTYRFVHPTEDALRRHRISLPQYPRRGKERKQLPFTLTINMHDRIDTLHDRSNNVDAKAQFIR
jgi:hypothetical protein